MATTRLDTAWPQFSLVLHLQISPFYVVRPILVSLNMLSVSLTLLSLQIVSTSLISLSEVRIMLCLLHEPWCLFAYLLYAASTAANESNRAEVSPDNERSEEGDKIVDGMDFGELCNEFECKSSPAVESTARQLVHDILQLRQGNRALGTFATTVKYKVSYTFLLLFYLRCGSWIMVSYG